MESADRIAFAASCGLRRNSFLWRQRLAPKKKRPSPVWLTALIWVALFTTFVAVPGAVDVAQAVFSPLNLVSLGVCGLALVVVFMLIPRTQPFRGYLDRRGLVLEMRGVETRPPLGRLRRVCAIPSPSTAPGAKARSSRAPPSTFSSLAHTGTEPTADQQ